MAEQIREARAPCRTEEDLKMRVDPILRSAFEKIGLDVESVRYEHATGYHGRIDALYGFMIIEYEAPGKLKTRQGYNESIGQLQAYLDETASTLGQDRKAIFSILVGVERNRMLESVVLRCGLIVWQDRRMAEHHEEGGLDRSVGSR